MESAGKVQHWNNSIASRIRHVRLPLIVGTVLIVMLAGLTGFSSLLGMMSALVLYLVVLVAPRPILIVYGLVLIMPLTDGLTRGAVVPFLRLGQALLALGFILFLLAKPGPLGKSRLTAIDLAFALFFLSEAVFPVLALYSRGEHLDLNSSGAFNTGTPFQTLLGPLQYYLVYRIAVATVTSEKQIALILKLSFIASIAVSVLGILEKFVAPVYTFIQTYYPPIAWFYTGPLYEARITSTMQAYTALASYLTATLIVALACSTAKKRLKISPILLATTLLLDSMALLLTGTFASFLGLAVGAGVVLILFRRFPKWTLIALVGIALSALVFQPFISARLSGWLGGADQGLFPTFNARIVLWQGVFLPAIGQHLLFGDGPAPAALNVWPSEETQYLGLLLRGGLLYFISYFLLMGVAMAICWRRIKKKSNDLVRTVAIATLAILVAINVMNVSSLYFTYPGITQTLFMLLGIIVASEQLELRGSSGAIEQSRGGREKAKGKTLHEPLDETTGIVVGKPADGLLTGKGYLLSSMPKATRPDRKTPPLERPRSTNRLRRVINNTIISFFGQGVMWISTLLLTIAYGRFLGTIKFGELYFAITFVALIGVPVNSGFDRQAVRDVAQKPEKATGYLSNMLLIRLGIWFILYTALLLASWQLGYSPEVRVLVAICGFDLLWNALAGTFASMHYAFERTIYPIVGNILEKGLSALFGILLLRAGAGVQTMAVLILVGSVINGVWQAAWFFRLVGAKFAIDLALIREILRKNAPFFINGLLLAGYTSVDTLLLSLMTNSAVVGWYGAANRLFDTMSFIPIIVISSIMYPIFSKLSIASDAGLKLAVEKSMNFLLFCGIPIATILIVAAPNIIRFLYGGEFAYSIPVLQAVAPGVVFAYINYALSSTILSKKQDRRIPIISAIALSFNVGLNLLLIKLYQATGAGIASSLTEVLVCCICVVFIPRYLLPFGSLRVALKALIASMVMALAILPLHTLHIVVILATAMLVYVGASVLLGVIPREDYLAVYHAIRQKAQPTSRPSIGGLRETQLPFYHVDASLDVEFATTMKLPAMRLQTNATTPAGVIRTRSPLERRSTRNNGGRVG